MLDKKTGQKVSVKEALNWSLLWIGLSFVFAGLLWFYLDGRYNRELANLKTTEFLTGYLIEKALSVDNIFVFLMIFTRSARKAPSFRAGMDSADGEAVLSSTTSGNCTLI